MKPTLSVQRVALLAFALATASITASFAQTTTTPSTTGSTVSTGGKHHHESVLTAAEKAQLNTARKAAYAADPSLKTEHDTLKQQSEALKAQGKGVASKDQKKTLHEQKRDFKAKLQAAELKADPTLAPIFAKLKAAHTGKHDSE